MKSFIPEHILEDIRNRADIVEVISDYVPLKSGGKNFKGLCPFHTEKTPSFTANREKQIYHCFGCGAGGNVFRFLMQIEDVPFMEAVRRLASRYQVSLPAGTVRKEGGRSWNEKEVLFRLNGRAAEFYRQQCLDPRTGKSAREYLSARKIDDATAAKFQLGWAPDQWRVLGPHLKQVEKAANGLLVQAGLSLKKEKESGPDVYYDRFRGRLMFPIADAQGRIIGFGGRTLDADGEPKYINSPETPVYVKGRHLYGLHLAKEPVRHRDHVLIVEGYFDVIRCFQAGVENVVAACGTALTAQQARTLRGFTQNAVLMYDADAAGQTAAERSFAVLIEQGMQIRVAALPPGHDPDSFLQEHGRDAFLEQVNRAPLFPLYFLDRCIAQGDPNSLEGKTEILNHLLPVLARIPNSVERAEWVRQTAERLKIEDRALLQELKKTLSQNRTRVTPPKPQGSPQAFDPERFLALLMLEEETAARRIREQVSLEEFTDPKYRELARLVFVELDAGRPVRAHSLVDQTDMPEVKAELARLALASLTFDNPKRAVDECAANLRKRAIAGKIKDLKTKRNQAHKAGLGEQTQRIHQELRRLQESLILI